MSSDVMQPEQDNSQEEVQSDSNPEATENSEASVVEAERSSQEAQLESALLNAGISESDLAVESADSEADSSAKEVQSQETQSQEGEKTEPEFDSLDTARQTFASSGQEEMPFALVQGQAMTQLPLDLYIPPDALEVILEQFEGPLDLLLYLIRKQNLDILTVNVAEITEQYMHYVELMKTVQLELAGEYLVMAAMLAEIKSRILLPRPQEAEEEEEDPRAELIRRLQEYERFKQAAEDLEEVPRMGRDTFQVEIKAPEYTAEKQHPDVDFRELMLAFSEVLHRADLQVEHEIQKEKLSTRERMSDILSRLQHSQFVPFTQLFTYEEGRTGVVTTFLATLELIKEQLIEIVQDEVFGPIHVKAKSV